MSPTYDALERIAEELEDWPLIDQGTLYVATDGQYVHIRFTPRRSDRRIEAKFSVDTDSEGVHQDLSDGFQTALGAIEEAVQATRL